MNIISGSIIVDGKSMYYHVKYENGTEESFFPYVEPVPAPILAFFKKAQERHNRLMQRIWNK